MEIETTKKCAPLKGGYADTLCETIEKAVQYHPTAKAKGLFAQHIINTKTLDMLGMRIILRSGDFACKELPGVVLNTCPFCGGELHDIFSRAPKHPTSEGDAEVKHGN